jgi:hypothetical protein
MNLRRIGCECVDKIHIAQGRVQWQTLVFKMINFRCFLKGRNFLPSVRLFAFEKNCYRFVSYALRMFKRYIEPIQTYGRQPDGEVMYHFKQLLSFVCEVMCLIFIHTHVFTLRYVTSVTFGTYGMHHTN